MTLNTYFIYSCTIPSNTLATSVLYDSNLKGVRKPREPRWNAITGGTLPCRKERRTSNYKEQNTVHVYTFDIPMQINKSSTIAIYDKVANSSYYIKLSYYLFGIKYCQGIWEQFGRSDQPMGLPGKERRHRAESHLHPDRWSGLCSQKYHHNLQVDKKKKNIQNTVITFLIHNLIQIWAAKRSQFLFEAKIK